MASEHHAGALMPPAARPVRSSRACLPGACRCGCSHSRRRACVLVLSARVRCSTGASLRRSALCLGEHLARSVRGLPGAPPAA